MRKSNHWWNLCSKSQNIVMWLLQPLAGTHPCNADQLLYCNVLCPCQKAKQRRVTFRSLHQGRYPKPIDTFHTPDQKVFPTIQWQQRWRRWRWWWRRRSLRWRSLPLIVTICIKQRIVMFPHKRRCLSFMFRRFLWSKENTWEPDNWNQEWLLTKL